MNINVTWAPTLLLIYLLPALIVLLSKKTKGREKVAWFILTILFSWMALLFYWLLAPLKTLSSDNAGER